MAMIEKGHIQNIDAGEYGAGSGFPPDRSVVPDLNRRKPGGKQ
jgi:hypothetical protein